jgi:CheY-like chemotaxis protein
VLVVDDNEDAGLLLAEMLRTMGHEVRVAVDGPRALDAMKHFTPHVAILDLGLPVMDGYELASELRKRLGSSVRLMALTGYGQERDRERSRNAGFDAHLVKPIGLSKILAAIEVATQPEKTET